MGLLTAGGGSPMHFLDKGEGRAILFIHGWLMSGRVWSRQYPLADSFRLICPDLRGHGETGGADFSYDSCVADMVALVDSLGLKRLVVVGWSMGAQIALRLSAILPERVAALVLVGGTPLFCSEEGYVHGLPRTEARSMAMRLRRSFNKAAADFFFGMFSPGEISRDAATLLAKEIGGVLPSTEVALTALDELVGSDLRPLLRRVRQPVLLVHGGDDPICLPGASAYMHAELQDSTLRILPDTGHMPFLTSPAEFNDCLSAFLRKVHGAD